MTAVVIELRQPRSGKRSGLTVRQRRALRWVSAYVIEHQRHPTLTEIGEAIGLKSKGGVARTLSPLFERGFLNRPEGRHPPHPTETEGRV